MTDRNRATTLRLRTRAQLVDPADALGPRAGSAVPVRAGAEPRRQQVYSFAPRRADPTSQAILAELAALGLAEPDEAG